MYHKEHVTVILPKVIYENLPYLYFLVSGALLVIGDSWALIFSAALFYSVACIVLVTRSANRRRDKSNGKHLIRHKLPEFIYEYLPYGYGAISIFTLMSTKHPVFQFIAFALFVLALRNLMCRHNNRTKEPSLF